MSEQRLASLLDRMEKVILRLESSGQGSASTTSTSASASSASSASQVSAFDEYLSTYVEPLVKTMNKIGGDLTPMATIVETGFQELKSLITVASQSKKPSDSELQELFKPIIKAMGDAADYRQSKRPADSFNHLSAVSEGIKALGWPGVPNTPAPYVREMVDAAQFYSIKVLTQYRKSGPPEHVDFVNELKAALEELANYVKAHHTTGLKWNAAGGNAAAAATPTAAATTTTPAATKPKPAAGGGLGDVFSAISKGTAITQGLRKVDASMKTKNQTDRVSTVPAVGKTGPKVVPKNAGAMKMGEPKLQLNGKKWEVEYQVKNQSVVIEDTDMKQTVYIYRCIDSVVQIKGKINAITLDGCQRVSLVFDECVASVELINCKSCKLQVVNKVPTITIDKTDGAQVYLSKESLDTTIVTSKSSEMNVNVPEDDDYVEFPVPEQYVTVYNAETKKLDTDINKIE